MARIAFSHYISSQYSDCVDGFIVDSLEHFFKKGDEGNIVGGETRSHKNTNDSLG